MGDSPFKLRGFGSGNTTTVKLPGTGVSLSLPDTDSPGGGVR
jgi:hypothetical protein